MVQDATAQTVHRVGDNMGWIIPSNGANAIGSAIMTGPANVTLDTAGDHYYICTFGTHCQNGQKLAITVSSSTGTSPGANPPTSAAGGPSGSVPGGSAPPPPSSSTTVLTSFVLSLSAIAFGHFSFKMDHLRMF
ncbi:hypothetical protein HAX54_027528 [Datura stramonium]|uniref:Phytocyanin domain-containing protein n=1 Tax=Datura stramonium TaxID=4076 RepID=A0ABS8V540_DATST|nr:hypothetical protein [Datura stramonium]